MASFNFHSNASCYGYCTNYTYSFLFFSYKFFQAPFPASIQTFSQVGFLTEMEIPNSLATNNRTWAKLKSETLNYRFLLVEIFSAPVETSNIGFNTISLDRFYWIFLNALQLMILYFHKIMKKRTSQAQRLKSIRKQNMLQIPSMFNFGLSNHGPNISKNCW